MGTIRERDIKLASNVSNIDSALATRGPVRHNTTAGTPAASSETNYRTKPAPSQELIGGFPSERFQREYRDPKVPCKSIPYGAVKRLFDILFSSILLLVFALPMLLLAMLIKLTSKGPVIFKQVRVTEGGRHFWIYKFRSMCTDAEAIKEKLMHLNEASGPVFKIKNDPRVTRIGNIMRKTSLDELPQLFNVLLGDMSIVGPRPPVPKEVEAYTDYQKGRLAVRGGLTCLWQVSGRSSIGFERWVELDLLYIEKMSFVEDVRIVLQTVPAVLFSRGAH